ncbi:condensation domain-containing protein [Streptomyces sp. NPDC046805]|uniref:condensation domain-containing protein n=1 Tax=Streptomyces sp. NPDC046805 TaxID=3155134 RepID=UPI003400FE25
MTGTEGRVRTLVAQALPEGADVTQGFVNAGGDSLAALRLVTALAEECGVRVAITTVLRSTSVAALTGALVTALPVEEERTGDESGPGAVSAAEREMLLEQTMGFASAHLVAAELEFTGQLDVWRLEAAMRDVVARHDVLRTRFWFDEEDFRREAVAGVQPEISHVTACDDELPGLRARELTAKVDLDGPLVPRFTLVRLSRDRHVLIVVLHHLTCDGWSLDLVLDELMELYSAHVEQRPPAQPEPSASSTTTPSTAALDFWTARLTGAPDVITVPPDRPRPPVQSFDLRRVAMDLPRPVLGRLRTVTRAQGATQFAGLLATWMLLLADRAGAEDVCVAVPVSGRSTPAQAVSIGLFVNTAVIRERAVPAMPFAEFLGRVHRRVLEAQDHQDVPFSDVVSAVAPRRPPDRQPLAQVMMAVQPPVTRHFTLPHEVVADVNLDLGVAEHTRYDLVFQLDESEDRPQGWIDYDAALYHRETVLRLTADYTEMVSAAASAPHAAIQDLIPKGTT